MMAWLVLNSIAILSSNCRENVISPIYKLLCRVWRNNENKKEETDDTN